MNDVRLVPEDGRTRVVLELSRAPEKVEHFTLPDPGRLVIDLYGPVAADFTAAAESALAGPHVERARIGRHESRVRVVLDLRGETPPYAVMPGGASVVAVLGERVEEVRVEPAPPPVAAAPQLLRETAVEAAAAVAAALAPAEAIASLAPETPEAAPVPNPVPPAAEETATAHPKPRRDPFRPFHLDFQPREVAARTPLEQYHLGSLKLVAVIYDVREPKAMVEDDAGLGYTIGVGTRVGDRGAVVKRIETDRVVLEQTTIDFYGDEQKSEVFLELEREETAATR